mmetsp:Transcript_13556/g.13291  ORF Transcript_13556/g.13291 Transcript_13556/m.13291 type:complete len:105 (+) Transcript_13556:1034-1348(+)
MKQRIEALRQQILQYQSIQVDAYGNRVPYKRVVDMAEELEEYEEMLSRTLKDSSLLCFQHQQFICYQDEELSRLKVEVQNLGIRYDMKESNYLTKIKLLEDALN